MAKILIVDDRAASREVLVCLLNYKNHITLEAADGAEALEIARDQKPDLIISDVLMPTMDGFEFVRQLRLDPVIGGTTVVFSTAHFLTREAKALADSCQVSFVLPKPCDPKRSLRPSTRLLGFQGMPARGLRLVISIKSTTGYLRTSLPSSLTS